MVEQCVSNGPERKTVAKNGRKERKKTETQRRTSDRIKSRQREEKEQLVRKRVQILDGQEDKGNPGKRPNVNATEEEKEKEVAMAERMVNQVLGSTEVQKEVTLGDASGAGGALPDKSATVKVKDTLRLFNKFYLQLVQVYFSLETHFFSSSPTSVLLLLCLLFCFFFFNFLISGIELGGFIMACLFGLIFVVCLVSWLVDVLVFEDFLFMFH
jgi:lipopolysaccharide export LptBFGC system permease protein LptF